MENPTQSPSWICRIVRIAAAPLVIALVASFTSRPAHAIGYVNALGGVVIPTGGASGDIGARFGYGFDAAIQPIPELSIGGYFLSSTANFNDSDLSSTIRFYGGEANYFLIATGLSFGLRAGSSATSVDSSNFGFGIYSTNRFAWGPRLGWEMPLSGSPLALGVEYSPMFICDTTVTTNLYTVHQLFVSARLYF